MQMIKNKIGKKITSNTVNDKLNGIDIKIVEEKFKKSKNSVSIINTAIGKKTETITISP